MNNLLSTVLVVPKLLLPAPSQDSYSAAAKHFDYDSPNHSLNAAARRDRYDFLRKHLKLPALPSGTLESVTPVK